MKKFFIDACGVAYSEYLPRLEELNHTQSYQVTEYDDLIIFTADDDMNMITADALEALKTVCSKGKPVVLCVHVPFEPQTEDEVKAVSEPATKADSFANLLSAKIDAFDSELALLEEEDKDIKNRIRDALAVKIENIKSEIAEMLPYVSAVYERCGKRIDANVRWGGMCYDKEHKDFRLSGWGTNANPIIYTLDKGTDENANESEIGLCKNIVEDWAELKSRIMMCCEDVLYSTLEEKKKIVKEHKDKLNDFEK